MNREAVGLLAISTNLHAIVWPWQVFRRLKRGCFNHQPSSSTTPIILTDSGGAAFHFTAAATNRKIKLFIWTSLRFIDSENNLTGRFK
jgi:hypothetical protein